MPKDTSFRDYILEQLTDLGPVRTNSMFGAFGLYRGDIFFGIVSSGKLYFKVDDTTKPAYEQAGMKPFTPSAKQKIKSYYEVPIDVIEDNDKLVEWARKAIAVQAGK